VRNRGALPTDVRPAIILLDGDEENAGSNSTNGRSMLMRPSLMTMRPELYVVLDERRLKNDTVGESLNNYRMLIARAIATDEQMATLLGSNGKVVYNGCATDLKSGSALTGQMRLDFAFTYLFVPTS
jgi:hypothetical protein